MIGVTRLGDVGAVVEACAGAAAPGMGSSIFSAGTTAAEGVQVVRRSVDETTAVGRGGR